jgi:tRNA pseudouridine55 synthase
MPSGLLNLNKPSGMTSRQVVDCIQRLVRPGKAGHAGTLDPLATGVLIVCVGAATRLIDYVQQMPKTYLSTFLLGRHSPTEDVESVVTELDNPPIPSPADLSSAAQRFQGQIQQRPPAFSALKIQGRRAYDLARKGKPVELAPRMVTVYQIEVKEYDYPRMTLEVHCGAGTYIRSLGRDLAESLGTAAVMAALERTAIGQFHVAQAVAPQEVTRDNLEQHLLPLLSAVEHLPRIALSNEEVERIRRGLFIQKLASISGISESDAPEIAAVDDANRLVAILTPRGIGLLGPLRNLS